MTLSSDDARRRQARAEARAARQARESRLRSKYPWLFPTIVGIAVVVLAGVVVIGSLTGAFGF